MTRLWDRWVQLPGRSPALASAVRALVVFVALADALLAAELLSLRHPSVRTAALSVLSIVDPVRPLAALALSAAALWVATRPKRAFHRVLVLLAIGACVLAGASGQRGLLVVAMVDGLVALVAESLWHEAGDPVASRLGWALLGAAAALMAVSGETLFLQRHTHRAPLFLVSLSVAIGAAIAGVVLLDRNPPVPARANRRLAASLYGDEARSSVSPFALMTDKRTFWAAGERACIAFGATAGVALALGPALGEQGRAVYDEFRRACRTRGWRPAFYQVPPETCQDLPGTRRLVIGSEALVDVAGFGLHGRAMGNVRHQVTRARREGVAVEVLPEADVPRDVRSAMRVMAASAATREPLGEMAFSVGRRDDPADVERTVALAFDADRRLLAYVTWLWLPAAATMVLDEVRRDPDMPAGTVELLIVTSLERSRGRARRASLGMAPIAGAGPAGRLAVVEAWLRGTLGLRSLSPGLYAFKAKFRPTWEPRYLVVERLADVGPVLLATLLLHFPDLAPRMLARGRATLARLP